MKTLGKLSSAGVPGLGASIVLGLSAMLGLSTLTAAAGELPRYVSGPISGLIYDCQQARQKAPKPSDYVTSGDLDGDGQLDYVIDIARGCQANRDLYCNSEGCSIDIYLSSASGQAGSFKASAFRFGSQVLKPALIVTRGGDTCRASAAPACTFVLTFDGKELVASP